MTQKAAAAAFGVAPATANRWWRRYRTASNEERLTGSWLLDRSSRPHRQPRRLSQSEEASILRARRETGLGPGRLAGIVRRARSTIWKVLHRHGLSRRRRGERQSFRRYEWSRPGALLHVDMAELPRFRRPGHRVTGDRSKTGYETRHGLGLVYLHCVVDDRSRYAYVEQHQAKDGRTAGAVLARALEHFAELGLSPPEAVLTDNAYAYTKGARLPGHARSSRRPPHHLPALHAALERQGGALHPHAQERVGRRPQLAQLGRPLTRPAILHPLLQPPQTAQLPRRTPTRERSQRLWAGQLVTWVGSSAARALPQARTAVTAAG
jgi:transposase